MKFKKTNGKHGYLGRRNSRWQRQFSKLGIKKDFGLAAVFEQIQKEKININAKGDCEIKQCVNL